MAVPIAGIFDPRTSVSEVWELFARAEQETTRILILHFFVKELYRAWWGQDWRDFELRAEEIRTREESRSTRAIFS